MECNVGDFPSNPSRSIHSNLHVLITWMLLCSFVTNLCAPPGEKRSDEIYPKVVKTNEMLQMIRSGERSRIYPKALKTDEIVRSVIIM